jgi:predicted AlkP superfamily phosphohydrolase/phosphomutase
MRFIKNVRIDLIMAVNMALVPNSTTWEVIETPLKTFTDDGGKPVTTGFFRPEELYHGPKTDLALGILFAVKDLTCAADPRYTTANNSFSDGPPSTTRSGGHRMNGIYVTAENGVQSGDSEDASLLNIAATLIYVMGVLILAEMVRHPRNSVFTSDFRERYKVTQQPLTGLVKRDDSARDTGTVQDQLGGQGYI